MIESLRLPVAGTPDFYDIKKFVYTLDYSFYYFVAVAFYYYIKVHINDIKIKNEKEDVITSKWLNGLIVWGL